MPAIALFSMRKSKKSAEVRSVECGWEGGGVGGWKYFPLLHTKEGAGRPDLAPSTGVKKSAQGSTLFFPIVE